LYDDDGTWVEEYMLYNWNERSVEGGQGWVEKTNRRRGNEDEGRAGWGHMDFVNFLSTVLFLLFWNLGR